ncbi:hypothetical protein ACLOJK_037086 [Asimina triloba]
MGSRNRASWPPYAQLGPGTDEGPGQLLAPVTSRTVVRTGRAACRWKRRDWTFVRGSSFAAGAARRARRLSSSGPTANTGSWLRMVKRILER